MKFIWSWYVQLANQNAIADAEVLELQKQVEIERQKLSLVEYRVSRLKEILDEPEPDFPVPE